MGKSLQSDFILNKKTFLTVHARAIDSNYIDKCINEIKLPVTGLMCIPPKSENPKQHFEYLSRLAFKYNSTDHDEDEYV